MDFLAKLRRICLALPQTREATSFGHPTFKAGDKTFAVLDHYAGVDCLAIKLELPHQQSLLKVAVATAKRGADGVQGPRFFPSPYGAKHGWVCMSATGRIDWPEVERLCLESYRCVAHKRMLAALDGPPVDRAASVPPKPAKANAKPKPRAKAKTRSKR